MWKAGGPQERPPTYPPKKPPLRRKKWEKINAKPRDLGSSDGGRGAPGLASGGRGGLWPCIPASGCSSRGP